MGEEVIATEHIVVEDKQLECILDAIDSRTVHQQMLHDHISDGFMALARERYTNPSSSERLGRLVYDNREDLKSSVLVKVEADEGEGRPVVVSRLDSNDGVGTGESEASASGSTLRRRGVAKAAAGGSADVKKTAKRERVHNDVRNRFMAIPSGEVREAIKCFRMAVDQAIEVANASRKVDILIQNVD